MSNVSEETVAFPLLLRQLAKLRDYERGQDLTSNFCTACLGTGKG